MCGSLLSKCVVFYCQNVWFFTVKLCGSLLSKYVVLYCQNVWFFTVKLNGVYRNERAING